MDELREGNADWRERGKREELRLETLKRVSDLAIGRSADLRCWTYGYYTLFFSYCFI